MWLIDIILGGFFSSGRDCSADFQHRAGGVDLIVDIFFILNIIENLYEY